jgi:hypothetical protein
LNIFIEKKGNGKCPLYNLILAFSELHASTGSTMASLTIQDDLDERFVDDFEENHMPPIRENSDDDEASSSASS